MTLQYITRMARCQLENLLNMDNSSSLVHMCMTFARTSGLSSGININGAIHLNHKEKRLQIKLLFCQYYDYQMLHLS